MTVTSATGSICFGVVNVRGWSRVPSPPTSTTDIIFLTPGGGCPWRGGRGRRGRRLRLRCSGNFGGQSSRRRRLRRVLTRAAVGLLHLVLPVRRSRNVLALRNEGNGDPAALRNACLGDGTGDDLAVALDDELPGLVAVRALVAVLER